MSYPITAMNTDPRAEAPAKPRALVMDDDPLFRTLLVAMLKRDYVVTVASDGAEGFYKALETPPDVAVIDIQMPGWDGLRTLTAFREHFSLGNLPLLVLSSDATRETLLAAIGSGADDYLIKSSFSREELLEKLQHIRTRYSQSQPDLEVMLPESGSNLAATESCLADAWTHETHLLSLAPSCSTADRIQETIDAWE